MTSARTTGPTTHETTVHAPDDVPVVEIVREFDHPPALVRRAWTEPDLFARWVGPDDVATEIDYWDCRTGGRYRFVNSRHDDRFGFFGSFHEIGETRLVQTFCFEGAPESVLLEFLWFDELPAGRTRVRARSIADSFESRDALVASGMEGGVRAGFLKLDALLETL